MSRAHNAKGTVREIAGILSSIADGAMMQPLSVDHATTAICMKLAVSRARSHYDLAAAAVRGSYWFAKQGDTYTADLIVDVMEGR
jgi:hypothetical protein